MLVLSGFYMPILLCSLVLWDLNFLRNESYLVLLDSTTEPSQRFQKGQ